MEKPRTHVITLPQEVIKAIKEMRDAKPILTAYPWSDMEIGDSILLEADRGETLDSISKEIETSIARYSKITGKEFAIKRIYLSNGFRVWRKE